MFKARKSAAVALFAMFTLGLGTGLSTSNGADGYVRRVMLYAFKSDTLSHVWKLWVIRVASFSRCFVGRSARQPSMAS